MGKVKEGIKKIFEEEEYPRSTYTVLYGDYGSADADTPEQAVTLWFKYEKDNRGDAAIIAYKKEDARKLSQWAAGNKDKIKKLHAQYDNPYKLDYILSSIDRHSDDDYKYFHEGGIGDQVDPFSFG